MLSSAHGRFHPKCKGVPCCQLTKEICCTEWQGNRGVGRLARNLPRICPEVARNSEIARNLLRIRSENGPDQPCAEPSTETWPKMLKPLSGRLKIFHRHFSKSFSPPKISKNSNIFTAICRGGHTKLGCRNRTREWFWNVDLKTLVCRNWVGLISEKSSRP